ncbi:hypothetical protein TNCV_4727281 [Trichonephila clavipes]|nr:hypothetical protein TNCV_4727281 [Trichonephila clavipes]
MEINTFQKYAEFVTVTDLSCLGTHCWRCSVMGSSADATKTFRVGKLINVKMVGAQYPYVEVEDLRVGG